MEQIRELLTQFSGASGYAIFSLLLIGSAISLPFNSDITLITASVLAARGFFNLPILMVVAFFSLLTGDSMTYWTGRIWGPEILKRRPFRWLVSPAKVKKAESILQNRGYRFIFFIRFMPFVRVALFFTSATLQVKPLQYYSMNLSATILYLPLIMGASFYAGSNIDILVMNFKRFQLVGLGVGLILFLIFFAQWKKR